MFAILQQEFCACIVGPCALISHDMLDFTWRRCHMPNLTCAHFSLHCIIHLHCLVVKILLCVGQLLRFTTTLALADLGTCT